MMKFDYTIKTQNDSLYWGRLNSVFVESDFLENEQINHGTEVRALNNCVVNGTYPILEIVPIDKPICSIQIFYKSELKLTKHFVVRDMPNPFLTSEELRDWDNEKTTNLDEVISSNLTLTDFKKIKRIHAKVIDTTGNQAIIFSLTQFRFSVLRQREVIFETLNLGEELSKEIHDFKQKIQSGDRLLIDNVVCHLSEFGNERRIDKTFNYIIVTIK